MRYVGVVAITGLAAVLAACSGGDSSKAEKVINDHFTKNATCTEVPLGLPVDLSKVGADGALGVLKAKGYITEGKATTTDYFGRKAVADIFSLTEKGKALVQREASQGVLGFSRGPCLRTGHFQVDKIEAIDTGNDIEGKPVASVRTRIKFFPEEWLADTRNNPAWSGFWKNIGEDENGPWLYPLLKSGADFYWQGRGRKIQ